MKTFAGIKPDGALATVITFPHEGMPPELPGVEWREAPEGFSYAAGLRWDGKAFVADAAVIEAKQWAELRATRNALLAASDWTQGADSPLSAAQKAAWTTYRQALRDITDQPGVPASVAWPTQP